ncbi:hypothetical protein, partial [Limnohabitans sp.]|uniref:hypothetical protein n=1 Tax=Limnohabitans sp. TaxID=1907725 RepID=UPI0039187B5D
MREIFQLRIIGPKSEQLVLLKNGPMSNRVRAQASQKFEILEAATGKAPKKIIAQRAGDDQIVKVIDEVSGEEFDLVIEDFHSANASLWGGNDAGVLQQYQIAGDSQLSQLKLDGGTSAARVDSLTSSTMLAGLGVLGIVAAAGSGGGDTGGGGSGGGSTGGGGSGGGGSGDGGTGGGTGGGGAMPPVPTPIIHTVAIDDIINSAEASNSIVITGSKEAGNFIILNIAGNFTRVLNASTERNWSYTLTAAEVAGLSLGRVELRATQTDVAGNVSAASTRTIELDTVLPADLELRLATDSGSSAVDGITNVSVVNIVGLEAGASWQYQIDGGAWIAGSG